MRTGDEQAITRLSEGQQRRFGKAGMLIAGHVGDVDGRLGAGRARAQDPVIHAAGIDLHVKPGDTVTAGQPLFTLLADDENRFARATEALEGAWEIGAEAPASTPLVLERITA